MLWLDFSRKPIDKCRGMPPVASSDRVNKHAKSGYNGQTCMGHISMFIQPIFILFSVSLGNSLCLLIETNFNVVLARFKEIYVPNKCFVSPVVLNDEEMSKFV